MPEQLQERGNSADRIIEVCNRKMRCPLSEQVRSLQPNLRARPQQSTTAKIAAEDRPPRPCVEARGRSRATAEGAERTVPESWREALTRVFSQCWQADCARLSSDLVKPVAGLVNPLAAKFRRLFEKAGTRPLRSEGATASAFCQAGAIAGMDACSARGRPTENSGMRMSVIVPIVAAFVAATAISTLVMVDGGSVSAEAKPISATKKGTCKSGYDSCIDSPLCRSKNQVMKKGCLSRCSKGKKDCDAGYGSVIFAEPTKGPKGKAGVRVPVSKPGGGVLQQPPRSAGPTRRK